MVTSQKLGYPKYFNTKQNAVAKKMMEKLLNRNPDARLGGSYASLKAHPWFDNFDWDGLHDGKMRAPYCPLKSSMISDQEINEIAAMKVPVVQEIQKAVGQMPGSHSRNMKPTIPDWDRDFEN